MRDALWALGTNTGIHKIVESAYKITLVVAFTPWWRAWTGRAPRPRAYLSIGLGLAAWLPLEYLATESGIPPQFAGLLMSVLGMVMGLW